jgi:uncharacterized protein
VREDGALLPPGLLEIMQCPECGGELTERQDPPSLVCAACAKWYPVEDGVPVMLVEEARPLP